MGLVARHRDNTRTGVSLASSRCCSRSRRVVDGQMGRLAFICQRAGPQCIDPKRAAGRSPPTPIRSNVTNHMKSRSMHRIIRFDRRGEAGGGGQKSSQPPASDGRILFVHPSIAIRRLLLLPLGLCCGLRHHSSWIDSSGSLLIFQCTQSIDRLTTASNPPATHTQDRSRTATNGSRHRIHTRSTASHPISERRHRRPSTDRRSTQAHNGGRG